MKYYWDIQIMSTGEIARTGTGRPTLEAAIRSATTYLIKDRDYDNPDEVYRVKIYTEAPSEDPGGREHGPVQDTLVKRDQLIPGKRPKAITPGGATWVCPSCQKGNVASSSDPRKVTCSNCGASCTVTGRHTDWKLIVQRFNMR